MSQSITLRNPLVTLLALTAMTIGIFGGALYVASPLLMAVVWGGVIAIAMRPCQRFLSRWIGEKSAALSIIAGALVLFVAASSYLTINLVTEASTVVSHFSSHKDTSPSTQTPNPTQPGLTDTQPPNSQDANLPGTVSQPADNSDPSAALGLSRLPQEVTSALNRILLHVPGVANGKVNLHQVRHMVTEKAAASSQGFAKGVFGIVKEIPHTLETVGIALLTAACCLMSYGRVSSSVLSVSANVLQREDIVVHIVRSIRGAVNGLVLVGFGEALVVAPCIVASGTPHSVILVLLLGIGASIPFCGYPAVLLIGGVIAASHGVTMAVVEIAFGLFVLFVGEHFFRPKFISDETRLPFLHTLIAILGGLSTMGLVGLFIGPALVAAAHMLWCEADGSFEHAEEKH